MLKIYFLISLIIVILFFINLFKRKLEKKKNNYFDRILSNKIKKIYRLKKYVNINEVESLIPGGRKWEKKNNNNEINIGFQLDPNYVLRVMMTLASIIDSQKIKTKLRFHFAVVLSFNVESMVKIYSLRERMRDDVEFNFYDAKKAEKDLKNLNSKGPGAVAKLLLPNLLPKDIDRLIIFDTGDLLVLKDLTIMYNLNMDNNLCLGIRGGKVGKYAKVSQKKYLKYINTGSILINVKRYKIENIYEKCVQNKTAYNGPNGDQDLLNDILFGKVGYLSRNYGFRSLFRDNKELDAILRIKFFGSYSSNSQAKYLFKTKIYKESILLGLNPMIIHQFNGKWMYGKGLTIYRRLAQYYIKLAGVWNEMCKQFPGYCYK
jgi:lipopolysaccharide biosynthesis glycosyltransferase